VAKRYPPPLKLAREKRDWSLPPTHPAAFLRPYLGSPIATKRPTSTKVDTDSKTSADFILLVLQTGAD
jgi:hypothetical protein